MELKARLRSGLYSLFTELIASKPPSRAELNVKSVIESVSSSSCVDNIQFLIARGFFLGCGPTIQSLWLGSPCHLSIPLLTAEFGSWDFVPEGRGTPI